MDHRQIRLLKELSEAALRLFWKDSFGGRANGSRHLHRVHRIARYLWEKEGGDEFLVLAGAWIHDVSLAHGADYDPKHVAEHTQKFLARFTSLRQEEVHGLVACAEGHESGAGVSSLEAQIVHDADVLDKSGLLGVVRHVWKMTHLLENRVLKGEDDLKKLEGHLGARKDRLFTKTARRLAKDLARPLKLFFEDRPFALETLHWVSGLAAGGMISDKVAETVARQSDHPCVRELRGQLACRYLQSKTG